MLRAIVAAIVILMMLVACAVEPEITVDEVDVILNADENPFAYKSKLTPEQASGDADVLVAYGAITHFVSETRGFIDRTPGRVIGQIGEIVEVVHSRQDDRREHVIAFMIYAEGTDTDDLHDDKPNIAFCRFQPSTYPGAWPAFGECSKVN